MIGLCHCDCQLCPLGLKTIFYKILRKCLGIALIIKKLVEPDLHISLTELLMYTMHCICIVRILIQDLEECRRTLGAERDFEAQKVKKKTKHNIYLLFLVNQCCHKNHCYFLPVIIIIIIIRYVNCP